MSWSSPISTHKHIQNLHKLQWLWRLLISNEPLMNFYQVVPLVAFSLSESLFSPLLNGQKHVLQQFPNHFILTTNQTLDRHVASNANSYSPKHFKLCVIQWLNTAYLDYDAHPSHRVISSIRLQYAHPHSPFKLGSYFYHIGYAIPVISSCDSLFHHGGMQKSCL